LVLVLHYGIYLLELFSTTFNCNPINLFIFLVEGSNKENKSGETSSSSSSNSPQVEVVGPEGSETGGASGYECDVEDHQINIEERDSSSTSSGRTNDTHDSDDYERNECLVRRQWFKAGHFDEYFHKLRLSIWLEKVRKN
jgi:hypothetical protein